MLGKQNHWQTLQPLLKFKKDSTSVKGILKRHSLWECWGLKEWRLREEQIVFFTQETLGCKDDFQDRQYSSSKWYTGQGSRVMENREAKTFALSFLSLTYVLRSSSEKVLLSAVTVCTPGAAFAYSSATHITKCALEVAWELLWWWGAELLTRSAGLALQMWVG